MNLNSQFELSANALWILASMRLVLLQQYGEFFNKFQQSPSALSIHAVVSENAIFIRSDSNLQTVEICLSASFYFIFFFAVIKFLFTASSFPDYSIMHLQR